MRRPSAPRVRRRRGAVDAIAALRSFCSDRPASLPLAATGRRAGLPGAAALSGLPRDPRRCDGGSAPSRRRVGRLMDEGRTGPKGETGHAPGNLTRITRLEEVPGAGPLGIVPGGTGLSWPRDTLPRLITRSTATARIHRAAPAIHRPRPPSFSRGHLEARVRARQRIGGGSYSGLPNNLGPFNGGGGAGGSGGGDPPLLSDPGDPSAPTPTPEPATILLIGSNVVLLGVASWRRFRSIAFDR